ncbi:19004_t:CDS:2 [Dentiscutata erythropus]|uniref:19004_t:CDS:1 n=1 Tax=Dentiscutata erythropus TaxID=1348616 RepID=A0A9N8Z8Z2_9GLOM|nr:19004_t:CDS:2 [Dentiscutata erythropus]
MVEVQEVPEGHEFSDNSDNESTSSLESGSSEEPESLSERLAALRDIIPEETRDSITNNVSSIMRFGVNSARFLGNVFWVLTTSAIILIMPLALELEREHQIIQLENEQKALMSGQSSNPYGQSSNPYGQSSNPYGQLPGQESTVVFVCV